MLILFNSWITVDLVPDEPTPFEDKHLFEYATFLLVELVVEEVEDTKEGAATEAVVDRDTLASTDVSFCNLDGLNLLVDDTNNAGEGIVDLGMYLLSQSMMSECGLKLFREELEGKNN